MKLLAIFAQQVSLELPFLLFNWGGVRELSQGIERVSGEVSGKKRRGSPLVPEENVVVLLELTGSDHIEEPGEGPSGVDGVEEDAFVGGEGFDGIPLGIGDDAIAFSEIGVIEDGGGISGRSVISGGRRSSTSPVTLSMRWPRDKPSGPCSLSRAMPMIS